MSVRNVERNIFTVPTTQFRARCLFTAFPVTPTSVSPKSEDFDATREQAKADAKRLFIASDGALDSESLTPPGSC